MKINIFGSTGIIGTKTLLLLSKYFPSIKINLLCANSNFSKLSKQTHLYRPKFVYLNNSKKIKYLKKSMYNKTQILNFNELKSYLNESKSDYSILAISGYKSLHYLFDIINNTSSLGLVSKESIVSVGHLFKNIKNYHKKKKYQIHSEHFSIFKY